MRLRTLLVIALGIAHVGCGENADDLGQIRSPLGVVLVGEWKLEDSVADTSGNGNDATLVGGTFVPGHLGRAISLGSSDSLTLGSAATLQFGMADAFSTSLWIDAGLDGADHALVGNAWSGPGWHVRITAANLLRFILVQDGATYRYVDSTVALTSGWHHVASTWDGGAVQRLYLDGVDVTGPTQTSGAVSSISSTGSVTVGSVAGASIPYIGSLDQLRLYRSTLAPADVSSLFAEGINHAPVAIAGTKSATQGVPLTVVLSASDSDGDALTFAIVTNPLHGTLGPVVQLSTTTASVQFTPDATYVGADSFSFRANDGQVDSAAATVSLDIHAAPPLGGLVGQWLLEDDALDSSGNGNDGTVTGASFVDGRIGRALRFNGIGDSMDLGAAASLQFDVSTAFSVSTFINATPDGANHAIIGNTWAGPGWHLRITSDNHIRFILVENDQTFHFVDSAGVLSAGWHHLAATWDGSTTMHIYVDGVEASGSESIRGAVASIRNMSSVTVGTIAGAAIPFKGDLDQLRLYSTALSAAEVANLAAEVPALNVRPTTADVTATTDTATPVTIVLTGADANGDSLTFAIDTAPTHGTLGPIVPISATTATVQYTPNAGVIGSDAFTFHASDGALTSLPATASLFVAGVGFVVGEWLLENDATDTSGFGNEGSVQGGTFVEQGKVRMALQFNGEDDYLDLGAGTSLRVGLQTPFSISTWVNTVPDGLDHAIIGNAWAGPGWHVRVTASNRVRFILVQDGGTYRFVESTVQLSSDWHHVAATWDGNASMHVYLDGIDVSGSVVAQGTMTTIDNLGSVTVGGLLDATIPLGGQVDQIRMYNVALSPPMVASLAAETASNTAPVANSATVTTAANAPVTFLLTGSDANMDALTFAVATQPSHGTLSAITPVSMWTSEVVYTPAPGYYGPDSFTFTANDGYTTSPAATLSLKVQTPLPTAGLVGEWKLEDNALDTSGSGNDGVVSGATFTDALFGRGLLLDGVNDSLSLGSGASLQFGINDPFTVSLWINMVPDATDHALVGNSWAGPGWHVRVNTANRVRFILVQDGQAYRFVDATTPMTAGWHHVVAVSDGAGGQRLYIDAVDVSSAVSSAGTVSSISGTNPITVGEIAGTAMPFAGEIDQLRIYARALDASAVDALYVE